MLLGYPFTNHRILVSFSLEQELIAVADKSEEHNNWFGFVVMSSALGLFSVFDCICTMDGYEFYPTKIKCH